MWDAGWDEIFRRNEGGLYPPEELVRTMARWYGGEPGHPGVKVLEIGCGSGANLLYLARQGYEAIGIDGSGVALDIASRRLAVEGLAATLHHGDVGALPFPDAGIDCVIDIECLYANSFADSRRIVSEIHRVLRPGGRFFSKHFMVGLSAESETRLDGEANTLVGVTGGVLRQGYGIARLLSEEEIPLLYGRFDEIEYDWVIRTDRNRRLTVKEWLIQCRK